MANLKHEIWLLSKAEISASVASIIDFGLAIGLFEGGILNYSIANLIGVICGGITNCCINYRYVFCNTKHSKKGIVWRYFLVWFGSMSINGFGTNSITTFIGPKYFVLVKCVVAFIVAIFFNYPLQRKFVFK